jgi:glucose-induced degradation protein 4
VPLTVDVPLMQNSKQVGINKSLLYNGSRFKGFQKSKGNSYDVEVSIQVSGSSESFIRVTQEIVKTRSFKKY